MAAKNWQKMIFIVLTLAVYIDCPLILCFEKPNDSDTGGQKILLIADAMNYGGAVALYQNSGKQNFSRFKSVCNQANFTQSQNTKTQKQIFQAEAANIFASEKIFPSLVSLHCLLTV